MDDPPLLGRTKFMMGLILLGTLCISIVLSLLERSCDLPKKQVKNNNEWKDIDFNQKDKCGYKYAKSCD